MCIRDSVSTQLPYCIVVAFCCFFGYLVAGFTNGNLLLTLGTSFLLLIGIMVALHRAFGGEKDN